MRVRNLQSRLTKLMFVFSILFIGMFTVIHLKAQLDSITRFNMHRAKLGAFITKKVLEANLAAMGNSRPELMQKVFSAVMTPLLESGTVQKAVLFSSSEEPIGSIGPYDPGLLAFRPRHFVDLIPLSEQKVKPFFTSVDKKNQEINIVIRLIKNEIYFVALRYSKGSLGEAWDQVESLVFLTVALVLIAIFILGTMLAGSIVSPVKMLNRITKQVAAGNLDMVVDIGTGDEFEELGNTFNEMTGELRKMKQQAENVNPLTKLPGNISIMDEVTRRIQGNEKFTVIYSDLNNFKSFNDHYGVHAGDEVIQMTADIMREAVARKGSPKDLVGHEGGDDFILVTVPEKADEIAQSIIELFDLKIKAFYTKEDIEQGFFAAKGRDGQEQTFPIMGIALAGVTNQQRELKSYSQVAHICAEVKKKAKSLGRSGWWIDKRIG